MADIDEDLPPALTPRPMPADSGEGILQTLAPELLPSPTAVAVGVSIGDGMAPEVAALAAMNDDGEPDNASIASHDDDEYQMLKDKFTTAFLSAVCDAGLHTMGHYHPDKGTAWSTISRTMEQWCVQPRKCGVPGLHQRPP